MIEGEYHERFSQYLWVFIVGGAICVIGRLLLSYTKLTSARILVIFVTAGVVLTALGLYRPLVELAGAGTTVPLTGFGYSLAKGVKGSSQAIRRSRCFHRRHYGNSRRYSDRSILQLHNINNFTPKTKK